MRLLLTIPLLAVLAGCTTPLQRCETDATDELRRLDRQIAATRDAIASGTRPTTASRITTGLTVCADPSSNVSLCAGGVRPLGRPVRADLDEEVARLEALERARGLLARRTAERLDLCRARYPGR